MLLIFYYQNELIFELIHLQLVYLSKYHLNIYISLKREIFFKKFIPIEDKNNVLISLFVLN